MNAQWLEKMLTKNRTRQRPILLRELHTPVARAVLDPHLDHQADHHQASMAHPEAALRLQLPRLHSSRLQLTDRF